MIMYFKPLCFCLFCVSVLRNVANLVYLCNSGDLYEHSYPVFVKDFLDFDYYNLMKIKSEIKQGFCRHHSPYSLHFCFYSQ